MRKTIYIVIFIILTSCKTQTESKKVYLPQSDFLKSKSFTQAKNQFGKLVDFNFKIDTLNRIKYDKMDFYKLNISAYDSIYIGKRNDTIFTYDQTIDFKEVFIVLDDSKTSFLGRVGTDFGVSLENSSDSIYQYSFKKIKNTNEGDHLVMDYEYPELTIKTIKFRKDGKILNLTIEQTINKK
ncbi:hypothetical protein [Mesonia aquimarina]|uniref:hypothetical protein n=1 Tax=Mesonia aquimarina TaxID=1504967 RepID=UPI0013CEBF8C|nr:hypothetical protein [Mesonia aquimarina]